MDEWQLTTEMAEKSVAQAIWRAHKDNYNLRMHEVYPLMARAAIGAMRAIAPDEFPGADEDLRQVTPDGNLIENSCNVTRPERRDPVLHDERFPSASSLSLHERNDG
jgi:hypothetical protein